MRMNMITFSKTLKGGRAMSINKEKKDRERKTKIKRRTEKEIKL